MRSTIDIAEIIACKYEISLPVEQLERLAAIMSFRTVEKGEVFPDQGSIAKDFIYAESGMIRQFYYKKRA